MSESEIVLALAGGLSALLTSASYPEELRIQLQHLVTALTTFLRLYLSVPTATEKGVYLRLTAQFIRTRLDTFAAYPRVTRYLQFVYVVTTQYLRATPALPATT